MEKRKNQEKICCNVTLYGCSVLHSLSIVSVFQLVCILMKAFFVSYCDEKKCLFKLTCLRIASGA